VRTYRVQIEANAWRQLMKLSPQIQERILAVIEALEWEPRPNGYKKLAGNSGVFRVKAGDYRIIYHIQDDVLLELVLEVINRREGYR